MGGGTMQYERDLEDGKISEDCIKCGKSFCLCGDITVEQKDKLKQILVFDIDLRPSDAEDIIVEINKLVREINKDIV